MFFLLPFLFAFGQVRTSFGKSVSPVWPSVWTNQWFFTDVSTGKLLDWGSMTYDATLNTSWLHNAICPQPLDAFGPFLNVSCDTIFGSDGTVWRIIPNIQSPEQCCVASNNTAITPIDWLIDNCPQTPELVYLWGNDMWYWNCTTDASFPFEYWSIKDTNLPFQNNFGGSYWTTPWVTLSVNKSTFDVPKICESAPSCPPNTTVSDAIDIIQFGSMHMFFH